MTQMKKHTAISILSHIEQKNIDKVASKTINACSIDFEREILEFLQWNFSTLLFKANIRKYTLLRAWRLERQLKRYLI